MLLPKYQWLIHSIPLSKDGQGAGRYAQNAFITAVTWYELIVCENLLKCSSYTCQKPHLEKMTGKS